MQKTKLLSLYTKLSKTELGELRKVVRSPFFNHRKDVIQLFDVLRQTNLEGLTDLRLFELVYPKKEMDKKALVYVMGYLYKVIEQYLTIKEVQQNGTQWQFFMAKTLLSRGEEKQFRKKIKTANQLLEKGKLRNLKAIQLQYELDMELFNLQKKQTRNASLNLRQPSQNLDVFLISAKLRQACIQLTHENVSEINYEYDLLRFILEYLESPNQQHLLTEPAVALYYFSYKTLKEEKNDFFQQFKVLLAKHSCRFIQSELEDFYTIGLNFCIKQINKGNTIYIREAFEWYQKALEEKVLFEHGILSQFHYKNIAALGLRLKEFDWVETFLIKHKLYLKTKNRELNFNYNIAKLYYEKKEYYQAMDLLQTVKYDDSLPNLTSKILLLKIYYELGEWEVLSSYLNSFERTVRRQRKLGYHKKSYLNLIQIVRKMLKLNEYDKHAILKLEKRIRDKKELPEKEWVLKHFDSLKSNS